MEFNKIYIISNNLFDSIKLANIIEKINEDYSVASTFNTNIEYSELSVSENNIYYISEDQLNLDFKNNALLYVITDSENQESIGIAIDEYYNNKIIPLSVKAFNTVKPKFTDDSLIVWYDSPIEYKVNKPLERRIILLEAKYLMNNLDKFEGRLLYFNCKEGLDYCSNIVCDFLNGDEEKRNEILEENS